MELQKYGKYEFFATCAKGLSQLLASELSDLGISGVRPLVSGVWFNATIEQACRALLWLRTASRLELVLARVGATSSDELYEECKAIPWQEHISKGSTIAVFSKGSNNAFKNSHFLSLRIKDAICDKLVECAGWRPSVDTKNPDLGIAVNLHKKKATISLDFSGKPMHIRGFRHQHKQVEAPIKETLASAILLASGWRGIARAGGAFVDPFCGGGTLAIEAAMIAGNIAPGIARSRWGIEGWKQFDATCFDPLIEEADELAEEGILHMPQIFANDILPSAVQTALANAKLAGLAGKIDVRCSDVSDLTIDGIPDFGLIATNPPYGERLMSSSQLPSLLGAMKSFAYGCGDGWKIAVVVPDSQVDYVIGCSPHNTIETYNGPIEVCIRVYPSLREQAASSGGLETVQSAAGALGSVRGVEPAVGMEPARGVEPARGMEPVDAVEPAGGEEPARTTNSGFFSSPDKSQHAAYNDAKSSQDNNHTSSHCASAAFDNKLDAQTQEFANRLRKMTKHKGKWAKRTGVTCYRVYDADLPDFSLSVDLYEGVEHDAKNRWAYICEYAPPKEIEPDVAVRRVINAVNVVREQFELGASNVFLKRRVRSKGGSQYSSRSISASAGTDAGLTNGSHKNASTKTRTSLNTSTDLQLKNSPHFHMIEENGLRFFVSFEQKIDTGIFLDSRDIRAMLRQMSQGKRFLNLFAYTGTATVYSASGGATSTHTVDMSQTYLSWAQQNMNANGFDGDQHTYERADVLSWVNNIRHSSRRFDLVYVDPPTFSNSKKMGGKTWDVQRDHVELLIDVSRILSTDGKAVFCCNLRNFKPDIQALARAGVSLEDITLRTIPKDFERNKKIHHCYILTRMPSAGVPAGTVRPVN